MAHYFVHDTNLHLFYLKGNDYTHTKSITSRVLYQFGYFRIFPFEVERVLLRRWGSILEKYWRTDLLQKYGGYSLPKI